MNKNIERDIRASIIHDDLEDTIVQPLQVGMLEEEASLGSVPMGILYTIKEFERALVPSRLCHRVALERITRHYGLGTKEMLVQLAWDNERVCIGVNSLNT